MQIFWKCQSPSFLLLGSPSLCGRMCVFFLQKFLNQLDRDVTVKDLFQYFHGVILSYGAGVSAILWF